ncbi:endonuclease VII domain-containing protein [Gordonia jacobaea]|uniref:endonuclease VII domain-containing protein n=1 Tax=Gordonia jacobaea TaxID=122202 RepID=UPI003D753FC8
MTAKLKACKECGAPDARFPGPRCYRHHRARMAARSTQEHRRRVEGTYDLPAGAYDALLVAQGGRCAICWAKPRGRRLAVDHDHETGRVRGLLCEPCNHRLLGRWSLTSLRRAVAYLMRPPAADVFTDPPTLSDTDTKETSA